MKGALLLVVLVLASCTSAIKLSDDVNPHQRVYDLFNGLLYKRGYDKGMTSGANGGVNCAVCTFGVVLVEQLAEVHATQVSEIMDNICSWLPIDFQPTCKVIIDTYGPAIIKLLDQNLNADEVCLSLKVCTNATCHLLTTPPSMSNIQRNIKVPEFAVKLGIKVADPTEYPWQKVADHKPFIDFDNDEYSTAETLRGYDWRGKDCDDLNSKIHPGRQSSEYSAWVDHNCNGIYGIDPVSKKSYEEILCSDTPQYGTINLGDSATAHFHVPEEWINPLLINNQSFANMLEILENELDWPHLSSGTAFVNSSSWVGAPNGPVDSSYLRYREINRCSHRDYQNVGVNGARSSSMANTIMYTFARDQLQDYPVMLTYALIGNDVCNGHPGTDHMTTPDEMYDNVMKTLQYLDTVLPKGSHVSLMGLVDGRILYEALGTRIYPAASVDRDITYSTFYDFLDCLEVSPCWGWTNSDEYWRNVTTERAWELNDVLQGIVNNNTFQNFDMAYFDCPLDEVVTLWESQGGEAWQLIEPVDGFHPNQIANALTTQVIWEVAAEKYPWLIPPTNPHNAQIESLFGDQGGYH